MKTFNFLEKAHFFAAGTPTGEATDTQKLLPQDIQNQRKRLLCGGSSEKRLFDMEAGAEATLRGATKTINTYATAFLIEHGYRASDLREFANRPLSAASSRGRASPPQRPAPL